MKRGQIPDPKDDKWYSSEDEDQEKEEGKSDPKANENPTTTENPSEKPSTPENPSEKPITPENPTTEDNMTRLNKSFLPITPPSPEKEKESPIVQPAKKKATGNFLKNKKSVAKSDGKGLTAEGILQALEPIEITPMKETQKETQKETEKKETDKDTQQKKETVKGKPTS